MGSTVCWCRQVTLRNSLEQSSACWRTGNWLIEWALQPGSEPGNSIAVQRWCNDSRSSICLSWSGSGAYGPASVLNNPPVLWLGAYTPCLYVPHYPVNLPFLRPVKPCAGGLPQANGHASC